ncbi:site-2 protease family protein [Nonomuraea sp. NPDC046802]|uniref:site-2 protease family protein n=1 Tax=Nonomuraea sp. NPDC046802 TaxID=3154919 RepID=UPI0033ECDEAB
MRGTLPLGTVAGIPVRAHWSALGLTALIVAALGSIVLPRSVPGLSPRQYWTVAVLAGVLFMVSLLIHELAHAVVARWLGLKTGATTLWVLGGYTELESEAKRPRVELAVAAVGPLASLGLGAVAFVVYLFLPKPTLAASATAWLATMNLLLGVFNLLPGAPLDGGRVLHALLWWRLGDVAKADRSAARAGNLLGTTLIAIGLFSTLLQGWLGGLWIVLVGWFIIVQAGQELTVKTARKGLLGLTVREVMTPDPDLAPAWMTIEDLVEKVVLNSRQTIFPAVDAEGSPIGFLTLSTLASAPPEYRRATRVSKLAASRRPVRVLAPDDEAARLIERAAMDPLIAVVMDGGRIVGMVTGGDLDRILRQAVLRAR